MRFSLDVDANKEKSEIGLRTISPGPYAQRTIANTELSKEKQTEMSLSLISQSEFRHLCADSTIRSTMPRTTKSPPTIPHT
jgi:hypothetical protein